jgi:hypothetical protein
VITPSDSRRAEIMSRRWHSRGPARPQPRYAAG